MVGGLAGIDETGWSDYLAGGSGSVSFGDRSQNISLSLGGSGGGISISTGRLAFSTGTLRANGGGIAAGTAFPTSPAAGDLFFRADLGLLAFFFFYAIAFTWAFDRVFGLPASAAG